MITEIPSCVLSQYLWYNANTQVDKTSTLFSRFSEKNIHYVSQLFNNNGPIKKLHEFKREYDLHDNYYFQWVQLVESISEKWKFIIKKTVKLQIILSSCHHLFKGSKVITLEKLTSIEIYSILIIKVQNKPLFVFILKICLITMILTGQ